MGKSREEKDKSNKWQREDRKANPDKYRAADKRYHEKHKDKIKAKNAKYRAEHKEEMKAKRKIVTSTPEWKAKRAKQERERRNSSPKLKLTNAIRTGIHRGIENKKSKTFIALGYSVEELMNHLESLFQKDMNWDNYGQWHIDHILPLDSFEFSSTDDSGFKECWSLSNLQPLWAFDNISKGNKII
jgi:hypothetical protein